MQIKEEAPRRYAVKLLHGVVRCGDEMDWERSSHSCNWAFQYFDDSRIPPSGMGRCSPESEDVPMIQTSHTSFHYHVEHPFPVFGSEQYEASIETPDRDRGPHYFVVHSALWFSWTVNLMTRPSALFECVSRQFWPIRTNELFLGTTLTHLILPENSLLVGILQELSG